jgi:hypothetical protein
VPSTILSYSIVADSAEATGLKWVTAGGGGKVLQVVGATTTTSTTIASTSYTDTTITATITPTLATSKILVLINGAVFYRRDSFYQAVGVKLVRASTDIYTNANASFTNVGSGAVDIYFLAPIMYYDSPATTSATTYKIQAKVDATANSGSSTWQHASTPSTITLLEIGA